MYRLALSFGVFGGTDFLPFVAATFEMKLGDMEAGLEGSKHTLRGLRYSTPSQSHFYMETQVRTTLSL